MLKTVRKDKVPKDHAYPVLNKNISEAFAGIPQYDSLSLCFVYRDVFWASEYNRKLKEQGSVLVFEVAYRKRNPVHSSSNSMIESGWYDESWKVTVVALPKEYVRTARPGLVANALPKARQWLIYHQDLNGIGTHTIKFTYDLYHRELRED